MSRWLLAASLASILGSFGSIATADDGSSRWARPPASTGAASQPVLDRARVRAKLAEQRTANLARFRAYQKAGVFPNNTYRDGMVNVWLDDDGHLCAAATLIKASGQDALVARTATDNNFIRLADVTQGPLMDWILTSGLTQAEIVAIQEPMMDVGESPSEPAPRVVDREKRKREDQRLIAKYREIDAAIVAAHQRSLELAVDRVMMRPELARRLLGG